MIDIQRCPHRLDLDGSDLHAESAALRAAGPAARIELPGGVTGWSLTDPALIKRLLTDPRISRDASRHWTADLAGEVPADWPLRMWTDVRNALTAYGPDHARLRRLIGPAFSARRVRALAPEIERITAGLLDRLAAHPEGEVVDLRAEFIWVLPLMVANTLLGVPEEIHDAFRSTIGRTFETGATPEEAVRNAEAVYVQLALLAKAKREEPGDDVTTALVQARDEETGGGLDERELLDNLLLLVGAGHETTVNLIGSTIAQLAADPQQLDQLKADPARWPDAVEETLRHQPPVANILARFPVEDVHDEPTGLTFVRGDLLVVNFLAAGRDPALHGEDAARYDHTRPTRRDHLSFGHGVHYCLGAELARLESRIALAALFERFPCLTLAVPADELRPLPSFISNGPRELPVLLHGRA
ncbi:MULTISPECIES: cytochrome P450 [Kitasatospora]|uniref:Putative cytochrome P450 n=1 Tax=Kitasatospora setae (strain ATCC 33774 / DSM 43861 / JCM 3304 / KCC A-0304 / NBRC 14216 / KM-6054) TaxID=452652 RepID=E4N4M5_KITSK|nr:MULTISPECIES: cytochrome P450 [Kitasatospora]BAJ26156.1 putative cytochrome P450 [Kitasatospora setae KM-6054]